MIKYIYLIYLMIKYIYLIYLMHLMYLREKVEGEDLPKQEIVIDMFYMGI